MINTFIVLTLFLLKWRIWRAPNNASKGQTGFNSAFKELIVGLLVIIIEKNLTPVQRNSIESRAFKLKIDNLLVS